MPFFDAMMEKYTLKEPKKRKYHRDGTLSKAEVMVILREFNRTHVMLEELRDVV